MTGPVAVLTLPLDEELWGLDVRYEFAVRTSTATNFEELSPEDQAFVRDAERNRDAWIAAHPDRVHAAPGDKTAKA